MSSKPCNLSKTDLALGRITGASPSENKYYALVMFDISEIRKYTLLTRLLKRYCFHIQNSVYEAYLRPSDLRELVASIEKLMASERYFNPDDRVRVYRMSGGCSAVVYGPCGDDGALLEENLFI